MATLPRMTPLVMGISAICLGAIFGFDFFNVKVGPLPLTLDRAFWGILGATVLIQTLRRKSQRLLFLSPIDFFLVAFVLVLIASTFLHAWQRSNNLPMARLLFFQLIPISFFWIGRYTRFEEKELVYFGAVGLVFGVYLALTGIAEKNGWHGLVFPQYIINHEDLEFFGRARGPFINPVGNGIVQIFCLGCACLLWKYVTPTVRYVLAGLMGLICIGVFCTMTRSVWLGLCLSAAITVWVCFPKASRGALISSTAVASILFIFVLGPYLNQFKRDEYVTAEEMSRSAGLRPMLFSVAYEMTREKPFFGHGYGQYKKVAGPYHRLGNTDKPIQQVRPYLQHNVFLAYLAELGLIGLGLAVTVFGCFLYRSWVLINDQRLRTGHRLLCLCAFLLTFNMIINGLLHDVSLIVVAGSLYFYTNGLAYAVGDQLQVELSKSSHSRQTNGAL